MPIYRYRCDECGSERDAYRRVVDRHDAPECHGVMQKVLMPFRVSVFQPYTTVCYDKETGKPMRIANKSDHKAFLRRNELEEVGNDKRFAPKSDEEIAHNRSLQKAGAEAAPTYSVDELKKMGWQEEAIT